MMRCMVLFVFATVVMHNLKLIMLGEYIVNLNFLQVIIIVVAIILSI